MKLQKCINCAYYTAYYKIQNHGFERSNAGVCSKHKSSIEYYFLHLNPLDLINNPLKL